MNYRLMSEIEFLKARLERVEGIREDSFRISSQAQKMLLFNETLSQIRRESMKGLEEPMVWITSQKGDDVQGIARMIHLGSRRACESWIKVNCSEFSSGALEAELFGYEQGAFAEALSAKWGALELAQGGGLFIEHIEKMDFTLQEKMLNILKTKQVKRMGGNQTWTLDIRFISAFEGHLDSYDFKKELYDALAQVSLVLPPLKERPEDILVFAHEFAKKAFKRYGVPFEEFSASFRKKLSQNSWSGGVQELFNKIEQFALFAGLDQGYSNIELSNPLKEESYTDLKKQWSDQFEKKYLIDALSLSQGNVSIAARQAKINRSNFLRLLRRHGIKAESFRSQKMLKAA